MIGDKVLPYQVLGVEPFDMEQANAEDLEQLVAWCEKVIQVRLQLYFSQDCLFTRVSDVLPPALHESSSNVSQYIARYNLGFQAQLLLVLALIPFIKPQVFDVLLARNENTDRPYTEFGGADIQGMYAATGDTFAFLLGGDSIATKIRIQHLLTGLDIDSLTAVADESDINDPLSITGGEQRVLSQLQHTVEEGASPLKAPLLLAPEHLPFFTTGQRYTVPKGAGFPAQRVTTNRAWDSISLPDKVHKQLNEITAWIKHGDTLRNEWSMADKIRPGYRALFYGPPGTGKTLTATMLGNSLGKAVYQVDLSKVHSKYIGETEKNLERLFRLAEQNGWLLFFDEADAVFGQRTQTSSANDQFANQNVSYLLQRIERFEGLVILASNYKENFDEAFFRRFESVIHFQLPDFDQRLVLWRQGFPSLVQLDASIDLHDIALKYTLSAAAITNIIRFVLLQALASERTAIHQADLISAIEREQGIKASPRW